MSQAFYCLLLVAALQSDPGALQEEASSPVSLRRGDDPLLLDEVGRIAGRVEILRGEPFVRPPFAVRVPDEIRSASAEIRAYGVLSRERLAARGRAWNDLGLGDAESPRNLLIALAADLDGIGFDPQGNRLLVSPGRLSPLDFEPSGEEDDPATVLLLTGMRPDAPLVSHLLMHVRQRERVGRDPLEPTTDGLLASAAWAEGEANLVAIRYLFAGLQVTGDVMQFVRGPDEVLDGALLPPGLDSRPTVEREMLSFVYRTGYERAAALHAAGGWKALDEAMARRTTTSELLHAERAPLPVVEPTDPPPPPIEGVRLADEDTLGEQAIVVLVASLTGKDSLGLLAGEGWAGDRLYRWEPAAGGSPADGVTQWITRWTSVGGVGGKAPAQAAADFDYALGRAIEARHAGTAFAELEEGARTLVAGRSLYRIERHGSEVRLLVRPLHAAG